jgi:rRNA maturation endonuclease Nob1
MLDPVADASLLAPEVDIHMSDRSGLALKTIRGRVDYRLVNYCATCRLKIPKEVLRCPDCGQKIRTRPWHRLKELDLKRI